MAKAHDLIVLLRIEMQSSVKNIIFDFDGVLADTKYLLYSIFKEIHPGISMEDFLSHHDGNIYLEPKVIFSESQMNDLFHSYNDNLRCYHIKNAEKIIQSAPIKVKLFIVSSNDEDAIASILREAKLLKRFSEVLGRQSGKSKIKKIKYIEKKHKISLSESVFITDTLGDIKEAKHCKIPCFAVTYGFHSKNRLRFGKPELIIDSVSDLVKVIASKTSYTNIKLKPYRKNKEVHHL